MAAVWFFVGAAIFLAVLWAAWRRWWNRLADIPAAARLTLIATTVGGFVGAFFWWQDVDVSFAWDLPPLASRLLGAAGTAFGATGLFALERPARSRARLQALMTVVYVVPLAVAVVLLHLDRFDFAAPVAWGFFAIVGLISAASIAALLELRSGGLSADRRPVPLPDRAWLLIVGAVIGVWGLALFGVPAAAWPMVFVWPTDPLTSRLIAVMLLTLSVASLSALRSASLLAQAHLLGAAYGAGVVAAIAVNVARGLPYPSLYLVAFAIVGLVSAVLLVARWRKDT